mmetsp:Transcript_13141/g.22960  ORF Transcript_13141/g.22960 Transcript_13141/m.22960 type:complete len:85 (+) Transcript_13141:295-549(+)
MLRVELRVELRIDSRIDSETKYWVISSFSADSNENAGVRVHNSRFITSKGSPFDVGSTKQGFLYEEERLVVPDNRSSSKQIAKP